MAKRAKKRKRSTLIRPDAAGWVTMPKPRGHTDDEIRQWETHATRLDDPRAFTSLDAPAFGPLADGLIKDFGFKDRDGLINAICDATAVLLSPNRQGPPRKGDPGEKAVAKFKKRADALIKMNDDEQDFAEIAHAFRVDQGVGTDELHELMVSLGRLRHAVTRQRGRPTNNPALLTAVLVLMRYWDGAMDTEATPRWQDGQVPVNDAMKFVHRVVKAIDHRHVAQLQTETEKAREEIVTARGN